ncbi:phage tail tape measure protein [Enterococcus faecium]|uniref:phage tail tape measure protein n=1 Tax=Enterococcus faecium TaxID=1352 RepID=UPI0033955C8E
MSADGIINIDILLGKKNEFLNDVSIIDKILKELGKNTGDKMDASFSEEAKQLENTAKTTKKEIDGVFDKPFVLKVDSSNADKEIKATKEFLKGIPKEKITQLKANNDGAISHIKVTKKEVDGIDDKKTIKIDAENKDAVAKAKETERKVEKVPNKKTTKFDADTKEAEKNVKKLEKEVEKSSKKLSDLQGIIAGTFGGTLAAKGVEKVTSSISGWIGQIGEAQDANIKLKNTLGLSEEQAKSYAAVTRGLFTSGYVDSIEDAADVVASLNTQLGDMPSGQLATISRYATILRDQFDMDLNEALRGVNSLMTNFGMDASTAFDYMVKGAQQSLNKTDELGDNLAEYGQIWSQAGFNAKDMFSILDNGLKSGAYNLDKVNDFVKEFTISLNDGRIEENIGSFSKGTQELFSQYKQGKATASDVFKSVISDLKNTKNEQEKLSTASTIWSALGEDNAMKVIESLGEVNNAFDDVSDSAEKATEETEKSFGVRFKNTVRKVGASLIPVGNKILDIAEKYMPSMGEISGQVFMGIWDSVDKVCSYLDSHKDTIVDVIENGKIILGIVADTVWDTFKDTISKIADFLDATDENGQKSKDTLQQVSDILQTLVDHKEDIKKLTKALMAMWATKKIFEFIRAVKEAKDVLMELKAVQLVVGDGGLLDFKGFKVGKAAKSAETAAKTAKGVEEATKLERVGKAATGGLKTVGRGIAGLDILLSLTELIGMNKQNAGKKIGAASGSIGGAAAGGTIGATIGGAIGSVVPFAGTAAGISVGGAIGSAVGSIGGTKLGEKSGEEIQKGLKKEGPGIKKTVSDFFQGNLGWEQSLGKSASKAVDSIKKKFTSAKKSLSNIFSSLGKTISKKFEPVSKFFSKLGKSIGKIFSNAKKTISKVLNSIKKTISKWGKTIKKVVSPIAEFITHVFKTAFWLIYGPIRLVFQGIEKIIKKFIKWVSPYISSAWEGIKKVTHTLWNGISDVFSSFVKSIKKLLKKLGIFMSDMWDGIKHVAHIAWNGIKKYILSPIKDAWEGVKKFIGKIWDHAVVIFEKLGKFIRKTWDKIKHDIITPIQEALKPVEKAASKIFSSVFDWFSKLWEKVSKVFGDILDTAKKLPEKIGKGFSNGLHWITSGIKDIANTMIDWIAKGVNGVLHGINWVLKKVHAPKDVLWDDWKPNKFAKGTQGKTTESQLAIINDAPGNDYQELVLHPDGKARIYEGRNRLTYLPKGSEVLEGSKTKDLLQMFDFPKYKEGTGKGILSTIWEKAKDIGENVMDFIDDPVGLLQGAVKKFVNFGQNLIDPYWTIAKGGVSHMVDGIKDWFVEKFQSLIGSSGSFDGAVNANGVYQYLVDIAQKVMEKFPGMRITSGYRPGDPYWHGKHQAIDIAYPSNMNGSSKYFDPANYAFSLPNVAYVITQGKVRDKKGISGQPATGQWEPWPDNDHYDHLHINGALGSGDIFKAGGDSSLAGLGAEGWRSQVIKAAKMVGFPTDKGHIDRIISQIQTESGGNERAVQGGYTDINTITGDLAKGLMQTISATFNTYKLPGHDNIFNGFDNIIAGLRYIMARYGTGAGFFANIGMGHGYANGGWATQPSIFGEVPGQPEVAINPKRDSADGLIIEAINARTKEAPNSLTAKISKILNSAKSKINAIMPEYSYSNSGINTQNNGTENISEKSLQKLIQAINERPILVESLLDGEKISKNIDGYSGSELNKKLYTRGK